MRFEININKWHLVAVLILFVFVSVVIAYGTSNPPNFGHSSGEIQVTGVPGTPNQTINSFIDFLIIGVKILLFCVPFRLVEVMFLKLHGGLGEMSIDGRHHLKVDLILVHGYYVINLTSLTLNLVLDFLEYLFFRII